MIPPTACLDDRQTRACAAMADTLAEALADPPPPEPGDDRGPDSPRWRGQSLSQGAAGVAVLHAVRARAGVGSWERVHAWLRCATREDLSAGNGAGLWFGAGSVAWATFMAATPNRYAATFRTLDDTVCALTRTRLDAAFQRIAARARPAPAEFDLTRGLTGLGAYLLHLHPDGELIRDVLGYLVRLCEPLPVDDLAGTNAPGWWTTGTPPSYAPLSFGGGYSDQGIAHGIAGPLALLALATRCGVIVEGHSEAMERICRWLDLWRRDGPTGVWWPEFVTAADLRAGQSSRHGPTRPSWCYGVPGLARAQQMAASSLGDAARQDAAEDALARCLSDPAQLGQITSPILCHGMAGVLATAWAAAADARTPAISAHLSHLVDALLRDHAHPRDPAGWHLPGLIAGTAGIALALHDIASDTPGGWQSCLLIDVVPTEGGRRD